EEWTQVFDELVELLDARLEQREHGGNPFRLRCLQRLAPQSGLAQPRFNPLEQRCRRQPSDVLLVEPVELLRIEHGVAAADPVEREERDQLVSREELAIAARVPSE